MRQVSLREANQKFSSCIAEVEAGERLVLMRRGKPVAKLIPFMEEEPDPQHAAALRDLAAMLKKGFDLKGVRVNREEIYDRGR